MKEASRRNINSKEGINMKVLFKRVLKSWYWFVIFAVLGVSVALFYNHYFPSKFEVSNTVLIKAEDKKESVMLSGQSTGYNPTLTNQVGIIKSYQLNLKAIENLNWNISIYEKGVFNDVDLYLNEPFNIVLDSGSLQTAMTPVWIKPISKEVYEVEIKEIETSVGKIPVNLIQQGHFGQPFTNRYFNFTITKNENTEFEIGQVYILIFNNLSELAHAYKNRLDVTLGDEDSDLIYIKLETYQPSRDVAFLNELVKVYLNFGLEEKSKVAENTMKFIQNQLVGITDSLQAASKGFTNFKSKNRIVDLGKEASLVVGSYESIEKEEAESKMRLEYYTNLKQYLNDAHQMKEVVAPSVVGITDPTLNALVLKLTDLYSKRELLSYSVEELNPNLISLDKTIEYTKLVLKENIDNLLSNTTTEISNFEQRKNKINSHLSNLPRTEQNMADKKRGFDLNNDLYTFLIRKRAEVGIAKASNSADATILDPARLDAAVHIGPSKVQIIIIGFALGLFFPFLGLIVIDYFDETLMRVEEVEDLASMPIVGNIFSNNNKGEIPVIQFPNSAVSETFRTLRTNLYHLIRDTDKKVFVVNSTRVGEGKSFISVNLASALAINNKRVLLVEADMRKPRLFGLFKFNREDGLSTYLNLKVNFEKIVAHTKIKGLSFIGPGQVVSNPSELLNSEALEKFVKKAKEHFDFIVIDSVPIGILSDASILGQCADVNLVILRMSYSKKDQLLSVNKLAYEGSMNNAVLVLNDVSDETARKQFKAYGYK